MNGGNISESNSIHGSLLQGRLFMYAVYLDNICVSYEIYIIYILTHLDDLAEAILSET